MDNITYKQFRNYTIEQLKELTNNYFVECKALLTEIESMALTEPQAYFLAIIQKYFLDNIKPYYKATDLTKNEYIEVYAIMNDYKDKLNDFLEDNKRMV